MERSISEKGTLQLAIDTDSVRRLLLEFARAAEAAAAARGGGADHAAAAAATAAGGAGAAGGSGDTAGYCQYVEREMGAAVALVKVLQARPESLLDAFILLVPPPQRSAHALARVCEVRGFTRKLTGELLALYARRTGSALGPEPLSAGGGGGAPGGSAGAAGGGGGGGGSEER